MITDDERENLRRAAQKRVATEEGLEQMNAAIRSRWSRPGARERASAALSGVWTPEARAAHSERLRAAKASPVHQYTLEGEYVRSWRSPGDVQQELGFGVRSALAKSAEAHGFRWSRELLDRLPPREKPASRRSFVATAPDGSELAFASMDAVREHFAALGVIPNAGNIHACATGKIRTCCGHTWAIIDDGVRLEMTPRYKTKPGSPEVPATAEGFFVYAFLDPRNERACTYGEFAFDAEPFYVGKGNGKRIHGHAYDLNDTFKRRVIVKIAEAGLVHRVVILGDGLTEEGAFSMEVKAIATIGRRDKGLGPLTNLTDGGEGTTGWVISEEERERRRKASAGSNNPWFGKPTYGFKGKHHSAETRAKLGKKVCIHGEIHSSVREAAAALGVNRTTVMQRLKRGDAGYSFV